MNGAQAPRIGAEEQGGQERTHVALRSPDALHRLFMQGDVAVAPEPIFSLLTGSARQFGPDQGPTPLQSTPAIQINAHVRRSSVHLEVGSGREAWLCFDVESTTSAVVHTGFMCISSGRRRDEDDREVERPSELHELGGGLRAVICGEARPISSSIPSPTTPSAIAAGISPKAEESSKTKPPYNGDDADDDDDLKIATASKKDERPHTHAECRIWHFGETEAKEDGAVIDLSKVGPEHCKMRSGPRGSMYIPAAIYIETHPESRGSSEEYEVHGELTYCELEQSEEDEALWTASVVSQRILTRDESLCLYDVFGTSDTSQTAATAAPETDECVICLTNPKTTVLLPCRHLCLCADCARELRRQGASASKCPVCRTPVSLFLVHDDHAEEY